LQNTVIVSPDVGNLKTATKFANELGSDIAIIDKRRKSGVSVEMSRIIGNVEGKHVLLFDDIIATGGTLVQAAKLVRDRGAKVVSAGATHALFAGPCVERLKEADFAHIWVTDTVPLREGVREELPKLSLLSVAELMGEAIHRIHRHESVSALFS
jgi:ribose-phosphate pyrophosphokinase